MKTTLVSCKQPPLVYCQPIINILQGITPEVDNNSPLNCMKTKENVILMETITIIIEYYY